MKVLDTTFLVDLLRGSDGAKKVLRTNETFVTTQINMYEIITGLFYGKVSQKKFTHAMELFETIRVLPLNDAGTIKSARICSELMRTGKIIGDCDCLTAGIALSNNILTIVTRNKQHFERIKEIQVETY